jgi:hypothetical protein
VLSIKETKGEYFVKKPNKKILAISDPHVQKQFILVDFRIKNLRPNGTVNPLSLDQRERGIVRACNIARLAYEKAKNRYELQPILCSLFNRAERAIPASHPARDGLDDERRVFEKVKI